MGVPAYALPGQEAWAMGLHAGARKRFKAEVVGLRKQFPRIIVKYTACSHPDRPASAPPLRQRRGALITILRGRTVGSRPCAPAHHLYAGARVPVAPVQHGVSTWRRGNQQ